MFLIMTDVYSWHTKQLDYVAAFPQLPVERKLYMKIPKEVNLQVINTQLGFKQSKIDEYAFYKMKVVYALDIKDSILTGPNPTETDDIL